MTSRDFCYWLQGFLEIAEEGDEDVVITDNQLECIKRHLNMVFKHEIDPSFEPKLDSLKRIHEPGIKPGMNFDPHTKITC